MTATTSQLAGSAKSGLPTLVVTGGVHRGVCLPLDAAAYGIGRGESAHLVLSDEGVAEQHLTLRLSRRHVSIEATGGDVRVWTGARRQVEVPQGNGYRASLPVEIGIGQARLRLGPAARPASAGAPVWYGKPQWLSALAFMFICAGALAVLRDGPLLESNVASDPASAAAPRDAERAASLEQARADLQRQARTLGLDAVQVRAEGGQLKASGTFEPGRKGDWLALQHYFDSRYGRHHVLRGDVAERQPAQRPRMRFQAVWFGTNPYVVDASGGRLYPGDPLDDGWVLERIDAGQVVLALGEERFALTLEPSTAPEG